MTTTYILIVAFSVLPLSLLVYLYRDYRRHKKPLTDVDPHVSYGLAHHVKVVTIPLISYRVRLSFERTGKSIIRRI